VQQRKEASRIRGFSIFIFNYPFSFLHSAAKKDVQRHGLATYEAERLVGQLTEEQLTNISREMFEGIISVLKSKPSGSLVELHMEGTGQSFILFIRTLLVGHSH